MTNSSALIAWCKSHREHLQRLLKELDQLLADLDAAEAAQANSAPLRHPMVHSGGFSIGILPATAGLFEPPKP
jgi:hypothetical protein